MQQWLSSVATVVREGLNESVNSSDKSDAATTAPPTLHTGVSSVNRDGGDIAGASPQSTATTSEGLANGCRHQFVVRTLHKPTKCTHCGDTLWLWEGVHYKHCKLCKVDIHDRCFRNFTTAAASAGGATMPSSENHATDLITDGARRFVHVHELELTRFYALGRWKCALCSHYITPGAEGLHCVSCDEGFCVHQLCYDALLMARRTAPANENIDLDGAPIVSGGGPSTEGSSSSPTSTVTFLARRLTEEEVAARATDEYKASTISDTVTLVQALCLRNVHWKTLLTTSRNPLVALPIVSLEHAKWYDACCAKVVGNQLAKDDDAGSKPATSVVPHNAMHGPMLALALGEIHSTTSPSTTTMPITGLLPPPTLSGTLADGDGDAATESPPALLHVPPPTSPGVGETMTATKKSAVPAEDISRLQDALRFATAVYGLAYQKNSMASCASSVAMRIFHPDRLMPKDEVNNVAVTEILALPRESLVFSHWSYKTLEPSFCVLLDHATSAVVLAFRGSLSTADFLSDACGLTREFGTGGEEGIAAAHFGMAHMVDSIFEDTADGDKEEAVVPVPADASSTTVEDSGAQRFEAPPPAHRRHPSSLIKILNQLLLKDYPTYELLVTGHSLGGGLSQLFAVRAVTERHRWIYWASGADGGDSEAGDMKVDDAADEAQQPQQGRRKRMRVVAFAPPPVLTMPSADWFDGWVTCVVGGTDVVCRLQLNTMDRLANNFGGGQAKKKSPTTGEESLSSPSEAESAAAMMSELTEEMHLVGRIVLLTYPTDKDRNRAVFLARGDFLLHHIFLVPDMISNHLMDRYAKGLRLT